MVHLKQSWWQAALPFCNHPVSSRSFLLLGCAGLEQEAVVLYCELISHRGSWRINAAGCRALAESSAAATAALLSSGGAPGPMQRCVQHRRGGHIGLHFQVKHSLRGGKKVRGKELTSSLFAVIGPVVQECDDHSANSAGQEGQRAAVPLHRRRTHWHGARCAGFVPAILIPLLVAFPSKFFGCSRDGLRGQQQRMPLSAM